MNTLIKRLLIALGLLLPGARLALAQTAQYPAAVAADSHVKVAANNVETRLRASVSAADTLWTVADASRIEANMLLSVDSEIVSVTSKAGNLLTVVRGFDGSTAAAHSNNRLVEARITSWHFNALREEIQAIQTALGANLENLTYEGSVPYALPSDYSTLASLVTHVGARFSMGTWNPLYGFGHGTIEAGRGQLDIPKTVANVGDSSTYNSGVIAAGLGGYSVNHSPSAQAIGFIGFGKNVTVLDTANGDIPASGVGTGTLDTSLTTSTTGTITITLTSLPRPFYAQPVPASYVWYMRTGFEWIAVNGLASMPLSFPSTVTVNILRRGVGGTTITSHSASTPMYASGGVYNFGANFLAIQETGIDQTSRQEVVMPGRNLGAEIGLNCLGICVEAVGLLFSQVSRYPADQYMHTIRVTPFGAYEAEPITSVSTDAGTATVAVNYAGGSLHLLHPGDTVNIAGCHADINGVRTVVATPSSWQFTVAVSGSPSCGSVGATSQKYVSATYQTPLIAWQKTLITDDGASIIGIDLGRAYQTVNSRSASIQQTSGANRVATLAGLANGWYEIKPGLNDSGGLNLAVITNNNAATPTAGVGFNVSATSEGSGEVVKGGIGMLRDNTFGRGKMRFMLDYTADASNIDDTDTVATLDYTAGFSTDKGLKVGASGTRIASILSTTQNWDPALLSAQGTSTSTTLTVTGCTVADQAVATLSSIGLQDVMISAHVQAANTVRVILLNRSGGATDIVEGSLRVTCLAF